MLEAGRSPAPTKATSEVQNSISTIEVAPSPACVAVSFFASGCELGGQLTPPVDFAERIAVGDGVAFSRPRRDAAVGARQRGVSFPAS